MTKKQKAIAIAQAASDSWLEHSFGWSPFLHDIESAKQAYNTLLDSEELVPITVRGTAEKAVGVVTVANPSISGGIQWTRTTSKKVDCTYHVYGKLRTGATGIRAKTGLTWGQFVPTVWELIPFSFLADYFTNIGDILSSTSVDLARLKWVSYTRVTRGIVTVSSTDFRHLTGANGATASGVQPPVRRIVKEVFREPIFPVNTPSFRFEFPFSPRKWTNMAALAVSAYQNGISSTYRKFGNLR